MTRARLRVAIAVILALIAATLAVALSRPDAVRPPREKPTLLLLTSLPLIFGEQFSIDSGGSPALERLQSRYDVKPISVTSPSELGKGRLLLMAHSLPQTPENLVALDDWVRAGGRVLLLADPMLDWPSDRPLGDRLRPPAMFMDTGLLKHWGLRLDAPDRRGPQVRKLGGYDVMTSSPGRLSGSCGVSADAFVARCRVVKGQVIVVADADFLDADQLGPPGARNLDALLAELASLEAT